MMNNFIVKKKGKDDEGSSSFRKDDGQVDHDSLFVTEGQLAPNEYYELVEVTPLTNMLEPMPPTERSQYSKNRTRSNIKYIMSGMALILIIMAIVVGSVCRNGQCSSQQQQIQGNENETTAYSKSPFLTSEDLIVAIDNWMADTNRSQVQDTFGKIQDWDVSGITNFSHLFSARRNPLACRFNENISAWNISSATTLEAMFYGAGLFEADISNWNVSKVTDMQYFMAEATFFGSDLSRWDTSNVINASSMFYWASNLMEVVLKIGMYPML